MGLVELAILASFLALISQGVAGRSISREEDLDLEKELKSLNKPAIKSIEMENGVIFDCVDINKQPSLDHPKLKNHKVQLRPSSIPEGLLPDHASNQETSSVVGLKDGGCPQGTVPIRRIQKGDLIRARSFSNDIVGHVAITRTTGETDAYYGAQTAFGINNPHVLGDQASSAYMILSNGNPSDTSLITVGWTVNPELYGDNKTRFVTRWTTANRDCYDTRCRGFVHINRQLSLGFTVAPISAYKGKQYEYKASVFLDRGSGDWWLIVGSKNQFMGYWPGSIFNNGLSNASVVAWGGYVYSQANETNMPEMGSGHFPDEGYGRAGSFDRIQYVKSDGKYQDPDEEKLITNSDKPNCYKVNGKTDAISGPGYHFFYGGPGGNC